MKKLAPVAMVSVALLAAALALLASIDGEPTPPPPGKAPPNKTCWLKGRVLDAAGAPLPGARVRARILTTGVAHESTDTVAEKDGTYSLRLFPARGRWAVHVAPPGRPGFMADTFVKAKPEEIVRLDLREPETPAIEPPEPNLSGEVLGSYGRLLTGIDLFVTDKEGEIVAQGVSGERGRLAFFIEVEPPLFVYAVSLETTPWQVDRLPFGDVDLIVKSPERGGDELLVDFQIPGAIENERARIRIYDDLGQLKITAKRGVREGPLAMRGLDFGSYDIRVDLPGLAGAIQGFDFQSENRLAVVPLEANGGVRGTLDVEANVILFSRSPTYVPVSRDFRESDGVKSIYRGAWEEVEATKKLAFADLPAGEYRLRLLAAGHETVEHTFALAAGEVKDFGAIDLVPATGKIQITITDRKDEPEDLEHRYIVRLYEVNGHSFTRKVGPGPDRSIEFTDLPAGHWMWRAERVLGSSGGMESTRTLGWDHPAPLLAGEEKLLTLDCTWRFDRAYETGR